MKSGNVSNNSWVEKTFKLSEHNTTIGTEVIAGITTFVTMAYVLGTVPNIMSGAGLDRGPVLTSMIILIVLTSVAMALVTNRPFALAPGLGSVAIVSGMMANEAIPQSIVSGVIFWSGVIFVIISYIGVRDAVVDAIPPSLKQAVSAGVGLFIALLGARNSGLIVGVEGKNYLAFGDFASPTVILAIIGFLIILLLKNMKVPGYMIIAILATTIIGIPMGITKIPSSFFVLPDSPLKYFMKIDFKGALNFAYIPFLIALFIPDFFSTFGTALGVGGKAGFLDEHGNLPGIDKVFKVDSISTVAGSFFCMPCMTTYLESSAGVEAGGKTGLTVVVTSICFLASLLITPIVLMIPSAATSPALIIIGVEMLGAIKKVNFDDYTEYFPAFLCIAFTVFANNIANGICVAIPAYVFLKITSRKAKEIPPAMYVLTLVCFLYFYTLV